MKLPVRFHFRNPAKLRKDIKSHQTYQGHKMSAVESSYLNTLKIIRC